ncbi:adenosylmethionine--8-amino-7-oxononanoate transaminase [Beggiatoa leptomitoformis]|uniref:Adenosylmethionine-8-amino-7-oxononanoate aminotransferase n=1 Tax=Beggiatoa leptomitoformis TaxID=288004 RepID=A0A2N9YGC4_9GAMM|nr:adenosylmethionine--8-amino-7-oxononanoate transaminase [Beggiatoa leptomitoformis]ALG68253.1 adenosylmethionine--8-amino-7-oxononanoate transaminase [Beggiatoa leptomitoformis]AUI69439.1 adenosylmethionine--8-amino-7-oxononanoate transaminase [Beggiatoa leptomitoformis]
MRHSANTAFMQRDLKVLWHPCTQMKDHEDILPLIPIKCGSGVWLEDFTGKRYLDAISSWWVNLFGHANPRINQAIQAQLTQLEHVILAGFTHEPVVTLSERLIALTPDGLTRCFYADNGSSGIEVAIKMSFHYWLNQGQAQKTKFLVIQDGYHGETLGALAVGDVALYKQIYAPLLMQTITAPSPAGCYAEAGESYFDYAERQAQALEKIVAQHADEVCAVIIEPLVQCAGGMRMHHPHYLSRLRAICDQYQIHLIADEIAVGFGRTGTLFACEQAAISPDFLCLSKGLTGGYLPLSVVLTHDSIYQAFYDDYHKLSAFLHSHSYTGNPLACQAALATLDIFETDNVLENNQKLAAVMCEATKPLHDHPHVSEVRQQGMILAIELCKNKASRESYDWRERRGIAVYRHALEQGALLRPLGNVVYFMPPYVITPAEIEWLATVAYASIDFATRD